MVMRVWRSTGWSLLLSVRRHLLHSVHELRAHIPGQFTASNPWSFRAPSRLVPSADLAGRRICPRECRRNGMAINAVVYLNLSDEPANYDRERSMLVELRRRVSATIARYRLAGWCSPTELRTIEALWQNGMTLRALARRDGLAPAAIGARIEGLHSKAPEFYRWWLLKNRTRRWPK